MKLNSSAFALLAFGSLLISGCGSSETKPAADTKPAAAPAAGTKPTADAAKPKATAGKKGAGKVDVNADVDPRDRRKKD